MLYKETKANIIMIIIIIIFLINNFLKKKNAMHYILEVEDIESIAFNSYFLVCVALFETKPDEINTRYE